MNKIEYMKKYRNKAEDIYNGILEKNLSENIGASEFNKEIKRFHNLDLNGLESEYLLDNDRKLDEILMSTYCYFVTMLEFRNKLRSYEYMDFSRRIGELWEPFCKLPFSYPTNELSIVEPKKFEDILKFLLEKNARHLDTLTISSKDKEILVNNFEAILRYVNSGSVNLSLDLHFQQNGILYNIDYKSGFSSNEKGNTNRLLMVGSIYKENFPEVQNMLFVRQKREDNNHYLATLEKSDYWNVYCAGEAYDKIKEYTGFDLKSWMAINMDWKNDISSEFNEYLSKADLIKYLTW